VVLCFVVFEVRFIHRSLLGTCVRRPDFSFGVALRAVVRHAATVTTLEMFDCMNETKRRSFAVSVLKVCLLGWRCPSQSLGRLKKTTPMIQYATIIGFQVLLNSDKWLIAEACISSAVTVPLVQRWACSRTAGSVDLISS
jgi:hypothetical protein